MLSDVTTYTRSETAVGVSLKLEDKFNSGRRSGQKEEQGKESGATVLCQP